MSFDVQQLAAAQGAYSQSVKYGPGSFFFLLFRPLFTDIELLYS
jgi:hypothetical protein